MTAEASKNEALEKLDRGIQESRQAVQQQTIELAQEYFDDSVEELRQQARERRATLENLPDQVPGGQEEPFQSRFRQLMEKYSRLEDCLSEARNDDVIDGASPVAEPSGKQEEVNATDAARREARKLGIDLTQVEGTGSGGRIVVWDVTEPTNGEPADQGGQEKAVQAARTAQDTTGQVVDQAQQTASRAAQKAGAPEAEGTGSGGDTAGGDVTDLAGGLGSQATGGVRDAIGQAGQVTRQVQQTTGGAAEKAASHAQEAAGGGAGEPRATSAARHKAEEMGVDLTKVEGTGSNGLITLEDVTDS